jgi:hypothetical protein
VQDELSGAGAAVSSAEGRRLQHLDQLPEIDVTLGNGVPLDARSVNKCRRYLYVSRLESTKSKILSTIAVITPMK